MEFTLRNGSTCIIRKVEKSDAAAMIEYLKIIGDESDNLTFRSSEITITEEAEEEKIQSIIDNPNGLMLMAFVDGTLAGNLTFSGGGRNRTKHVGEFGLSVRKDFWGMGIGRKLLNSLFMWAEEGKIIKKINLQVRSDNYNAIQLYLTSGFQMEGHFKRSFLIDGEYFDTYAMGKEL